MINGLFINTLEKIINNADHIKKYANNFLNNSVKLTKKECKVDKKGRKQRLDKGKKRKSYGTKKRKTD
jgi:hypothetical protein